MCVLSVVVTFTWPEWNMFLIMAYGRSPGALLRVIRLFLSFFLIFSGWARVARFIVALWSLYLPPKYPGSRYVTSPDCVRSIWLSCIEAGVVSISLISWCFMSILLCSL